MDKFRNKYRIPSARAQWWDYSNAGAYFVTICTAHQYHFFGEIVKLPDPIVETRLIASLQSGLIASIQPSPLGALAIQLWNEIPDHFKFIELGAFVVMPNHVHGILVINDIAVGMGADGDADGDAGVQTRLIASLPPSPPPKTGGITGQKNPMLYDNISRVVRWYKGRCTYEMRKIDACFGWQSRFHDHIIRDDDEYLRIKNYIETNPDKWEDDKFFKDEK